MRLLSWSRTVKPKRQSAQGQHCSHCAKAGRLSSPIPKNITAPVLFRLVGQFQPTLLLDEVDAYLHQAEELRGLLNAGHKRGACAHRCEDESNQVRYDSVNMIL